MEILANDKDGVQGNGGAMPEPVAAVGLTSEGEIIRSRIYTIRGVQVMLDRDLALLYGVQTKALNQAVKRNGKRFPPSFMFQLGHDEVEKWKSQFVTSNLSPEDEAGIRMGLRRSPFAFTEQGVVFSFLTGRSCIISARP